MSERTVRVNGVCLTESQVRETYAELAGDRLVLTWPEIVRRLTEGTRCRPIRWSR